MKKIQYFLYTFMLSYTSFAHAFTTEFKCENCSEKVIVPLTSSNVSIPNFFYLFFFLCSIYLIIKTAYKYVRREKILMSEYITSFLFLLLSCGYYVSNYFTHNFEEQLVGEYQYNNQNISFRFKGNDLVNENNQKLEVIGQYIYDKDNDKSFIQQNKKFYLIDFEHKKAYQLNKI